MTVVNAYELLCLLPICSTLGSHSEYAICTLLLVNRYGIISGQILKTKCQQKKVVDYESFNLEGGSPGLVVMGDDSCFRGHGFESQCCRLDGHFLH